ncbi:MAG: threonine ammonia-lyase [Armatimonadota bacterium]
MSAGILPTIAEVRAAAARVASDVRRTPIHPWDQASDLWLKLESLQPTGSFKVRGASNHLRAMGAGIKGVVAASSGNHGQAVAYMASRVGVPAVIVVPETVTQLKQAGIARYGAEMIRCGTTMPERSALAARLAKERGLHLVPSFDDPLVIAGQGTCGLEILDQCPEVSAVVVPTGGGGLISGIALAIKALRPSIQVIGAEPQSVARFAASRAAGTRVTVPSVATIADGLRGQQPGLLTWDATSQYVDAFVSVDDEWILDAVRRLCVEAHLVVEPSGAIAVAALLGGLVLQRPALAVISGGNLDPSLLAALLSQTR